MLVLGCSGGTDVVIAVVVDSDNVTSQITLRRNDNTSLVFILLSAIFLNIIRLFFSLPLHSAIKCIVAEEVNNTMEWKKSRAYRAEGFPYGNA